MSSTEPESKKPTIGVIIRYKDSEKTLPDVLNAIQSQSVKPDKILAINNDSSDSSTDILKKQGVEIISWKETYHHAKVLNFGVRNCNCDLILILSSHTVMREPNVIERYRDSLNDEKEFCVSCKWDADTYYTDSINWDEIKEKGIKIGSIYSNSIGMFKRSYWLQYQFNEEFNGTEDYDWALFHIKNGGICKRMDFEFDYVRNRNDRIFRRNCIVRQIAKKYKIKFVWLGLPGIIKNLFSLYGKFLFPDNLNRHDILMEIRLNHVRIVAFLSWRFLYNISS